MPSVAEPNSENAWVNVVTPIALREGNSVIVSFTCPIKLKGVTNPEAKAKASELLLRILSPEERAQLESDAGWLYIASGGYEFRLRRDGAVEVQDGAGDYWRACVGLEDDDGCIVTVPAEDETLAYYLAIKSDPRSFRDEIGLE